MRTSWLMAILICLSTTAWGQKVTGYIYDAEGSNEPLIGASVYYKGKAGTHGAISDTNGYYEIHVPEGGVVLTYSFLGYESVDHPLVIPRRGTVEHNVFLKASINVLDEVVVSVGRFEQKLSDITVSMSVMKAADIARQNPSDLRTSLASLPGVEITDKQPSIRSGSGWTYGVGSRSLILVDGLSILTPGVGEINWNAIPVENIEQVEVIKGASSVLYGSSALNGIINVRTTRPGLEPETRVNMYLGIYGNPSDENAIWWDRGFWKEGQSQVKPLLRNSLYSGIRNPIYEGFDFSHARRIGDYDVSASLSLLTDEGYRQGNYNKRMRLGGKVAYHDPDIQGLTYGTDFSFLSNNYGDYFLWRSADEPLRPSPFSNMARQENNFYIDPFLNYHNAEKKTTHRFRGRLFYRSDNLVTQTTDASIVEIADNMGVDVNQLLSISTEDVTKMVTSLLPKLLTEDYTGVIDDLRGLGKTYFPDAKSSDYADLISWVMGHWPLPISLSDGIGIDMNQIIPFLNGDNRKQQEKVTPDKTAQYYLDYQFSKRYETAQLTAGVMYDHLYTKSANMTRSHQSDNAALYLQYDDKFFDRLNLSVGMRLEYYRVDSHYKEAKTKIFGAEAPFKPVFRAGLNYQLAEYSFLRASFGQGYRYPSLIEKYVRRDVGGIGAYPNNSLTAESGFNTELGIRQGYKVGPFKGFLDAAAFYTQYKDMIEFNIGLFNNDTYAYIDNLSQVVTMLLNGQGLGIGAQFSNVSDARIYGVDISTTGIWEINRKASMTYNIGYVYTEPEDMNYKKVNELEAGYTDPLQFKSKSNTSKYLKYRQKHSVKGVFDFQWNRLTLGTNMVWRSKTLAVDYFMVDERQKNQEDIMDFVRSLLFGDLDGYWRKHNKSHFVMDLRAGVKVTNQVGFQFSVQNLLNTTYMTRPMDVAAPRTFVMQMTAKF
ncbi:MAG: TonB-dependent receptor [Bacteroides sp.]|nr:TonB-dependent receptor [Bacteroides sp.]